MGDKQFAEHEEVIQSLSQVYWTSKPSHCHQLRLTESNMKIEPESTHLTQVWELKNTLI